MQTYQTGRIGAFKNVVGPGAKAVKYDLLTALLVTATRGNPVEARLALRLSLLITARFNWRSGTFSVGQREIARMWGVSERTAKRELAEMRTRGWITVSIPSARGRVAQHRIEFSVVLEMTKPHWDAVGTDFVSRMTDTPEPEAEGPTNVVPIRPETFDFPNDAETGWSIVARRLNGQDPAMYRAWLSQLLPVGIEGTTLRLRAPSRFVAEYIKTHYAARLMAAITAEHRHIRDVQVSASTD